MIDRRAFLAAATGMLAAPRAAEAQQSGKPYRIGLLSPFSPSDTTRWHQAFREGLRDLGWVEGKTVVLEYRYANGRDDRLPALIAELMLLKVDVIVTSVTNDAVAAKRATTEIPIVMASAGDPVGTGIVASLARPGGNITGLSQMAPALTGKRLELLKEIVPKLSRVGAAWNPEDRSSTQSWKESQVAARDLGIQVHSLEVRRVGDIDRGFEEATRARVGAVVFMPNPIIVTNLKRVADLAARRRLPSIFHIREFADAGGLVAYGVDRSDLFRRSATYVDRILRGAKPGDLPIEQAAKFELVINLKTAKALGLTIPQSVLIRADQVIE